MSEAEIRELDAWERYHANNFCWSVLHLNRVDLVLRAMFKNKDLDLSEGDIIRLEQGEYYDLEKKLGGPTKKDIEKEALRLRMEASKKT